MKNGVYIKDITASKPENSFKLLLLTAADIKKFSISTNFATCKVTNCCILQYKGI